MDWKMLLTMTLIAPTLAFFGGVGVLFWHVGETWDARNTDSIIVGMVAVCGTGGILVALMLAAIIAIPLARRIWANDPDPMVPIYENPALTVRTPPPKLLDDNAGAWQSAGPTGYDLWADAPPPLIDGDVDNW